MAKLAIKGHAIRGNEVIEILEMLGGRNPTKLQGNASSCGYYIDSDGNIAYRYSLNEFIQFTIEEFLERFPYKVGDKVWLHYKNVTIRLIETITRVHWCSKSNCILYDLSLYGNLRESDLTPYKEETMEDKDIIKPTTEINLNHPCFDGRNEIELIIPKGWAFEQRDGKMFGVRKQYPKTYEECCKVLCCKPIVGFAGLDDDEENLYGNFIALKRCRDAYWKIAGEQMGLDKLWKPYNGQESCKKHVIQTVYNNITCLDTWCQTRNILEFPTEEMRDAFYENFKELIESCKELL